MNRFGEVLAAVRDASFNSSFVIYNRDGHIYPVASPLCVGTNSCAGWLQSFNDGGQIAGNAFGFANPGLSGANNLVLLNPTYSSSTPTGTDVTYVSSRGSVTFDQVTATGTTTVLQIDPATAGTVPNGFAISNLLAYEVSTTATFTGSATIAFKVPIDISETDFNNLRILHNENGTLVDVTTGTPPRDFATHTIYASVTSFSPFYAVRAGTHINALFDQTKAYKSGSTVPVKFQVLNGNGSNVSASTLPVTVRQLKYLGADTTAAVVDSGNANPDYQFRYDASLGGYIFNLSTKGLAPGRYGLSFFVGAERSFFYSVAFQVK